MTQTRESRPRVEAGAATTKVDLTTTIVTRQDDTDICPNCHEASCLCPSLEEAPYMTDYPTPEQVRRMMELRAYVIELGLDPKSVVEIAEMEDYSNATGTTYRITMQNGDIIEHDGPWFLDADQKEAALGAAERLEQIWTQLHEMPMFRPKEWDSPTAEEQP